ncbi:MAG: endonuclease [Lentisphaerae bacterium]|nr:endonuclease [Lentisphaerota bacterium]
MRFLLYNIRYGTKPSRLFPWGGYLGRTSANLERITGFIADKSPDVIGLVEVDAGSYRSGWKNQAKVMAETLQHYHVYRSKYRAGGLARLMPLMSMQGNAFLARDSIRGQRFHYFERGVKRLVIELELDRVTFFLVHLALGFRVRHHQLNSLHELLAATRRPYIVAGDFNAIWGGRELNLFAAASGLASAAPSHLKTFPSWAPRRPLDFILHSEGIKVTGLEAPRVSFSDHLPLVCDFEITG